MPTLGEACQTLRIGRVTLDKWIKRLGIETTRHEWDYRYQLIAPEDVERIAEARKKLPTFAHMRDIIPPSSLLAFDRRQSDSTVGSEASSGVTSAPRQRPLRTEASTPLPDGMMSRTDAADLHGVPRSTFRRWCDDGRIETAQDSYGGERGQFAIAQPVTRSGLAQLYALAHRRSDFQACQDCPHDSAAIVAAETSADGGEDEG